MFSLTVGDVKHIIMLVKLILVIDLAWIVLNMTSLEGEPTAKAF